MSSGSRTDAKMDSIRPHLRPHLRTCIYRRNYLAFSPTWTGSFSGVSLLTIINIARNHPYHVLVSFVGDFGRSFPPIDLSEKSPDDNLRCSDSLNTLGLLLQFIAYLNDSRYFSNVFYSLVCRVSMGTCEFKLFVIYFCFKVPKE